MIERGYRSEVSVEAARAQRILQLRLQLRRVLVTILDVSVHAGDMDEGRLKVLLPQHVLRVQRPDFVVLVLRQDVDSLAPLVGCVRARHLRRRTALLETQPNEKRISDVGAIVGSSVRLYRTIRVFRSVSLTQSLKTNSWSYRGIHRTGRSLSTQL
jgi:hypothetical protein